MKKLSFATIFSVVMVVAVLILSDEAQRAEAVTCNPVELSPCIAAFTSNAPPSRTCCGKLREQRPCLCGYIKDPNYSRYVSSPNAKRIASSCGVPYPRC